VHHVGFSLHDRLSSLLRPCRITSTFPLRTSLFWAVSRCRLVICYQSSPRNIRQ